ncbi:MAG TPA: PAS domain-containing protein [Campylobacterales bacterium]|nr:PAS domain-containing protein [Campylobacterales bacterium]
MSKEVTFEEDEFIVSKTDLQGRIIYGNELFIKISGYSEKELLGSPHNILRHPDMPKIIFKLLWETIKNGKEIIAFVKNKAKGGGYYWVEAQVTPSVDNSGKIIGFHSARRKPKKDSVAFFEKLYKELLDIETKSGVDAAGKRIKEILESKGVSYEQFILSF